MNSIAATNSPLRVHSLSLHLTPDRSRLRASLAIAGDYRLPAGGQSGEPDAPQTEYQVLSERGRLREAALECYRVTQSTLPSGWQLESLNFQDGKRLSAQGIAPADQVPLLEDVRAKIEKTQSQNGKDLFVPASGEATMRMAAGMTNFSWSMQFDLKRPESG